MSNIYLALAGALAVLMVFHGGRVYERRALYQAQVEQLKEDATKLTAIAAGDQKQKSRVVENIKTVERLVPVDDCYRRPMPSAVLDGLRDAGAGTGPAPDR